MSENLSEYGYTSVEGLRALLEIWPKFISEHDDALNLLSSEKDLLFTSATLGFSWCHLYELPIKEHSAQQLKGFLQDEKFLSILQNLVSSKDQLAYMPELFDQLDSYINELGAPSKAEAAELLPLLPAILGLSLSSYHSLRCVLYYGYYLNELIDRVRNGDDKALFNAVRIDSTVVGCKPVIQRISKAAMLQDHKFLKKLKAAINGKINKREQSHYQKMRLVFEVLHEAKAVRLTDQQLYQLFVEELALYHWDEKEGGNAKALRKFADTYMKQYSTT